MAAGHRIRSAAVVAAPVVSLLSVGCETDHSEQGALDPQNPRPVPCGTSLPGVGTMID